MPYSRCFQDKRDGCVQIEFVTNDIEFAEVVATALRTHDAPPPVKEPAISNALQGNLAEFCVWDLGERRWRIYERKFTWTPNASSPWRPSSDPGIDILALTSVDDEPLALVFEVKSSRYDGSNLVHSGNSSLRADFEHLFMGDIQSRLAVRIGAVCSDLRSKYELPDLATKVKGVVGKGPSDSENIRLIGVLVCTRGDNQSQTTRSAAFGQLQTWLLSKGWKADQIECRCIEVGDFPNWLRQVITRASYGHA